MSGRAQFERVRMMWSRKHRHAGSLISRIPHPASRHVRCGERGFTFIEIMVVVAILAILAALVIPRFMGRTDDA